MLDELRTSSYLSEDQVAAAAAEGNFFHKA